MKDLVDRHVVVVHTTQGLAEPVLQYPVDPDNPLAIGHDSVPESCTWVAAFTPLIEVGKPW
jgi:hypothetical protein